MHLRNHFLSLTILVFVGACAAAGPEYSGNITPVNKETAVVCVYRPDSFMLGGAAPDIYVDDERRFRLRNNGFNIVHLAPGTHLFEPRPSPTLDTVFSPELLPTELSVKGGEVHFLKLDLDEAGFDSSNINAMGYYGHVQLSVVDENIAKAELVGTRWSE